MKLKSFFLSGLLASLVLSSSLFASTLVNGISVLVNDEPITLYEVHMASKQMDISLKEALDLLVQRKLEISQVKKLGISVSEYEVQSEVEQIAKKNGISTYELRETLAARGVKFLHYKQDVKKNLKIKKLYEQIFKSQNANVSEQEIRSYYKSNSEKFRITDKFKVTTYRADNKIALQDVINAPMRVAKGASLSQEVLKNSKLERRTAYFLEQTKAGEFTPIVSSGSGYVMYLLHDKIGTMQVGIEQARAAIVDELQKNRQKIAVKNYFEKLRADASIVVIRKP